MSKFIPIIVDGASGTSTPYRVETNRQFAPFYAFGTFDGATITLEWSTEAAGVFIPFIVNAAPLSLTEPIDLVATKLPQDLYIRTNITAPGGSTSITLGYYDA